MTRNIDYYLSLNYPIEILQIPENDGGGVSASIPLLGRLSCVGDGENIQEAIEDLTRVKRRVLEELLAKGDRIPEPESDEDAAYSGRILLRLPSDLHRKVAKRAEAKGESTNRYIVNALEADARIRIDDIYVLIHDMQAKFDALTAKMNSAAYGNYPVTYGFAGNMVMATGLISAQTITEYGLAEATEPRRQFENARKLKLVG